MTRPFVKRYDVPIYGSALYIVFAATVADGVAALPKDFRDDGKTPEDCAALTLYCDGKNTVSMVFSQTNDVVRHSSITHEAFHATDCILNNAGVHMKRNDANEAYAYLCGWIAEQVYDAASRCARSLEKHEQKEG